MAHDGVWPRSDDALPALFLNLHHRRGKGIGAKGQPDNRKAEREENRAHAVQPARHMRELQRFASTAITITQPNQTIAMMAMKIRSPAACPFWIGIFMRSSRTVSYTHLRA